MGRIDDHYAAQQPAEEKHSEYIAKTYNRSVELLTEVLGAILRHVRAGNLPETCEWVYDNGTRVAAWELCRDYDGKYKFYLLAEKGRLVRTERGRGDDGLKDVVTRTLNIRPVRSAEDEKQRAATDIAIGDLGEVVKALVGAAVARFGLPDAQERLDRLRVELWGKGRDMR